MSSLSSHPDQSFERDVLHIEAALRNLGGRKPDGQASGGGSRFPWRSVAVAVTIVSVALVGRLAIV